MAVLIAWHFYQVLFFLVCTYSVSAVSHHRWYTVIVSVACSPRSDRYLWWRRRAVVSVHYPSRMRCVDAASRCRVVRPILRRVNWKALRRPFYSLRASGCLDPLCRSKQTCQAPWGPAQGNQRDSDTRFQVTSSNEGRAQTAPRWL